jgi:hypothetical protein
MPLHSAGRLPRKVHAGSRLREAQREALGLRWIEMRMAFVLVGTAGLIAGCGSLPWVTRDPPQECGFPQDAKISWAGRGDPVALGIVQPPPGEDLGTGEIWVMAAPPSVDNGSQAAFCYIGPPDQGVAVGTLRRGWEPP